MSTSTKGLLEVGDLKGKNDFITIEESMEAIMSSDSGVKVLKYTAGLYILHFIREAIEGGFEFIQIEDKAIIAVIQEENDLGNIFREKMRELDPVFPRWYSK
ncbi:MAG: hypothetical protein RLZZ230_599 [Candidatus Parcubacteria bacterium]